VVPAAAARVIWRVMCDRCAVRMPLIDAVIEDMQTLGDAALDTSSPFDEATVFGEVRGLRMRMWAAGCKAHAGDGHDEQGAGAGQVYDYCS